MRSSTVVTRLPLPRLCSFGAPGAGPLVFVLGVLLAVSTVRLEASTVAVVRGRGGQNAALGKACRSHAPPATERPCASPRSRPWAGLFARSGKSGIFLNIRR